jgi:hypothetical protein
VLALQTAQVTHPAGAVSDYLRYLLDLPEIWARAYAQYIAIRSGNAALGRALAAVRSDPDMLHPGVHWTDADFTPIATAIDDLFKEVGWRR